MNILSEWLRRIWYLLNRNRFERELQKEMDVHRSMMDQPIRFGNTLRLREEARDAWGWTWFDEAKTDVSYALRLFRSSPGFTFVAILMIAIGIGANASIFTQVNAVLLKSLSISRPQELEQLEWTSPKPGFAQTRGGSGRSNAAGRISEYFSYAAYQSIAAHSTSFSQVLAFNYLRLNVGVHNTATRLQGQTVSGNYFETLDSSAVVFGRPIIDSDDNPSSVGVAVLSYGCWQQYFGSDLSILGQELTINGSPFTVVGITAKTFHGLDPSRPPDIYLPIAFHPVVSDAPNGLFDRENWAAVRVVGRLKSAVLPEQARVEAELLVRQLIQAAPVRLPYELPQVWLSNLDRGVDDMRRNSSQSLLILMAVVGVVLVIMCANLAGLMLARASARQREIATRLAIGAPATRLLRQLLTESMLLAAVGGTAGIAVAFWFDRFFAMLGPETETVGLTFTPDIRVMVFCALLVLGTGIATGLIPAIRAGRLDVISAMKQTSSSFSRFRTGKVLVAVQVGLSLSLLIAAGLLSRTLLNLREVPLGVNVDGLLQFASEPSLNGYKGARRADYFEEAIHRIERVPEVVSVSLSQSSIVGSSGMQATCIPDYADTSVPLVGAFNVAPRFFQTTGIPILLGRDFTWDDREGRPNVVIVNEAFAKKYFAGKLPLGMAMGIPFSKPCNAKFTVIGVVADAHRSIRGAAEPLIYEPYRQVGFGPLQFTVRAKTDPTRLVPTIRQIMLDIDPNVPIYGISTQLEQIDRLLARERLLSRQFLTFSLLALLLSAVGVYGTLNYLVTRKSSEIGIRMALGAQRNKIIRLVLAECSTAIAVGMLFGCGAAAAFVRSLRSLLFGVTPADPLTIAVSAVSLMLVTLLAAYLPARRATRIDPVTALRQD